DRCPSGAADDAARDLRAARVIDDRAARVTDVSEIPPPRVGIPRLAGGSKDEERRAVLRADRILTGAHQAADCGRRDPEVRHTVALDERIQPRCVWEV